MYIIITSGLQKLPTTSSVEVFILLLWLVENNLANTWRIFFSTHDSYHIFNLESWCRYYSATMLPDQYLGVKIMRNLIDLYRKIKKVPINLMEQLCLHMLRLLQQSIKKKFHCFLISVYLWFSIWLRHGTGFSTPNLHELCSPTNAVSINNYIYQNQVNCNFWSLEK